MFLRMYNRWWIVMSEYLWLLVHPLWLFTFLRGTSRWYHCSTELFTTSNVFAHLGKQHNSPLKRPFHVLRILLTHSLSPFSFSLSLSPSLSLLSLSLSLYPLRLDLFALNMQVTTPVWLTAVSHCFVWLEGKTRQSVLVKRQVITLF